MCFVLQITIDRTNCSGFVVGLEPLDSFLAGAEFLASRAIVPIVSIWMRQGWNELSLARHPLGYEDIVYTAFNQHWS